MESICMDAVDSGRRGERRRHGDGGWGAMRASYDWCDLRILIWALEDHFASACFKKGKEKHFTYSMYKNDNHQDKDCYFR